MSSMRHAAGQLSKNGYQVAGSAWVNPNWTGHDMRDLGRIMQAWEQSARICSSFFQISATSRLTVNQSLYRAYWSPFWIFWRNSMQMLIRSYQNGKSTWGQSLRTKRRR